MKGKRGIWQRWYWIHLIRDKRDFKMRMDYIHHNPVKHGYVKKAKDWPYSSIHQDIKRGAINNDCGNESSHFDDRVFGDKAMSCWGSQANPNLRIPGEAKS